jgi:aspartyl aminopeptidase
LKTDEQVQGFLDFVNASPSAFHAVQSAKERLLAEGFVQIKENEEWKLKAGQKYFFTRNHSSIFAFVVGGKYVRTPHATCHTLHGTRHTAHTDSSHAMCIGQRAGGRQRHQHLGCAHRQPQPQGFGRPAS